MLNDPYIQIRKLYRATNNESKEFAKYAFEKVDSISIWIIGLSIGSISLFASNIKNIKLAVQGHGLFNLNTILLLLFISVVCGIFYRIIFLLFYMNLNNAFRGMDIALSDEETMDTESMLLGEEDFNQLHKLVSQYIDIDDNLKLQYQNAPAPVKTHIIKLLISDYEFGVKRANKLKELVFDNVSTLYSTFFPMNKDKLLNDMLNPKNTIRNKLKFLAWLCIGLYITFMGLFLVALATFLLIVK